MFSKISAVKLVLILMAIWFYVACSDPEKKPAPGAPAYPAKISVVDGVRTVLNPEYPRDGRVTYDMIEELSIGEQEGDVKHFLTQPVDIDVADNGDIYVSDWKDIGIQVYDESGSFLRTIGRQGQGPGDFDSPFYFCLASDGRICVLDMRAHRISVLDAQGNYLSGFGVPGSCYGLKIDGNDRLYFRKINAPELTVMGVFQRKQNMDAFDRTDLDGMNFVTLFSFKGGLFLSMGKGMAIMSLDTKINSMWAVHKTGDVSVGFNETYEIYKYDSKGIPRLKFGRSYIPVKRVLPEMELGSRMDKESVNLRNMIAKNWPAFQEFVLDENDNLWVRIFTDEKKEGCVYDVFSPDGIYIKQVELKHPVKAFKNGRAYSIVKDGEDEIPMVKKFRLEERSGKM